MNQTLGAACLLVGAFTAGAQTQIGLRTQSEDVDFSAAASTRPFRVGTQLPAACSVGWQMWGGQVTSVSGRSGAVVAGTGDYQFSQIGGTATNEQLAAGIDAAKIGSGTVSTVLTIGTGCSSAAPCNVRFGNTAYSIGQSCTATLSAGSGTAFVYVAANGAVTVGHNVTLGTSGCQAQSGVTNFPSDSIPLATWTATGGTWDSNGGRDFRAMLSSKNLSAGTGISTLESGGRTTVSVDTSSVPTYVSGSATLDFPAINAGACSADLTITVYGAAVGDAVAAGWPAGLEAGLMGMMRVSATDTVAVRLCNFSGGAVNPASGTYRAMVIRSF